MASIQVQGILKDPFNLPAINTPIYTTAKVNEGETPAESEAEYITDGLGAYAFELVYGTHDIHIQVDDTCEFVGTVVVNSGTPDPVDIISLLNYTTELPPHIVIPGDPNWDNLLEDVREGPDSTSRQLTDSISDEISTVDETKKIYGNERLGGHIAEETLTVVTGSASVVQQPVAFHDTDGFMSATLPTKVTTESGEGIHTLELYEGSDGNLNAKSKREVTTPDGKFTDNIVFNGTEGLAESDHSLSLGTAKYTSKLEIEASKSVVMVASAELDEKYITRLDSIVDSYIDDNSLAVEAPKATLLTATGLSTDDYVRNLQVVVEDAQGAITGKQEKVLAVGGKELYERHTNDGTDTVATIHSDIYEVVNDQGDTVFSVDTVNNELTINGKLTIGNPDDFKGEDGNTVFEVFKYSPTSEDAPNGPNWHEDFVSTDYWRITNTSINGEVDDDTWSTPILLQAVDGAEGDTVYYEYQYSVDGLGGWHDTLLDGDFYRRERLITASTPNPPWSAAAQIAGADGDNGEIVLEDYQYSIDGLTVWHTNFSTGDHYRRTRLIKYAPGTPIPIPPGTEPIEVTDWSAPAKLAPVKGIDYFDGAQGLHGSGSWVVELSDVSLVPTNDEDMDIQIEALTNRPAQAGDILTYVGNNTVSSDDQFNKQFLRSDDTASSTSLVAWGGFQLTVNGDAIINGTLAAEKLIAATITGDKISATTTMIAGSANQVAGMSGVESQGFWAGHADPDQAPYRVTRLGKMVATDVDLTGSIRATAGSFEARMNIGTTTSGSNWSFLDGGTSTYAAYFGGGNCWIKKNGDFYANNGTFNGTVQAEKINGDVVSARRISHAPVSRTSVGTSLFDSVGVATSRPYTRTLVVKLHLAASIASSGESPPAASIRVSVYSTGAFGTVQSRPLYNSKGSGSNNPPSTSALTEMVFNVPADSTGTQNFYIKVERVSSGSAIRGTGTLSAPSTNNYWTPQLFKNGGDLSG